MKETYCIIVKVLFATIAASFSAFGQSGPGNIPVSRIGYGLPTDWGLSRYEGMAGCGQAAPTDDFPNLQNPALLQFNRKVNLNVDLRYQYRNLQQPSEPILRQGYAGPANLSVCMPLSGRISGGLGIRPFSFRDYTFREVRYASGDSIGLRTRGSGGLSQAFLSFGFRLSRNWSLGIEASYVFGTLQDSVTFGVLPSSLNYSYGNIVKQKTSQLMFRPGIHFMQLISKEKEIFIAAGVSADPVSRLSVKRYNQFLIPGTIYSDTLEFEVKSAIDRPPVLKTGISLFSPQFWSISLEADYTKPTISGAAEGLRYVNAWSWKAGGEFRPGSQKSTSYVNLITYRAGIALLRSPYAIDNNYYSDLRFSAGASFPITRKEAKFSRPFINLSISGGQRGTLNSGFGRERYFQVTLGFTLNDFLWFNRYKID